MPSEREYEFTLVVGGIHDLSQEVEDAVFDAGCGSATLSIQNGLLHLEFSRSAASLQDAIDNAIHDVEEAGVGPILPMPEHHRGPHHAHEGTDTQAAPTPEAEAPTG